MDPVRNPFAPGAGSRPPELAGRDELLERIAIGLDRLAQGRPVRGYMLYGLRGTGKTVLLGQIQRDAESRHLHVVRMEAPEGRSLPALLAPALRGLLLRLDRSEAAKQAILKALRTLAGFAKLKVHYQDLEVSLDVEPEPGMADSGSLEADLGELLQAIGEVAKARKTAVILSIDEFQYVREAEMAALVAAIHTVGQANLPLMLIAAGLPQLLGQLGRAKSYTERLFEYVEVGALDHWSARQAIMRPIEREGEGIESEAVESLVLQTQAYPYFLQEWGKHAWDLAFCSPVTTQDVTNATLVALAELDSSFFRVRFDRLTPSEKKYMRAMAELGEGPHRSADIADTLGKLTTQLAPIRNSLIKKGMLHSPAHGDTAFTVPMFDAFMRRILPKGQ